MNNRKIRHILVPITLLLTIASNAFGQWVHTNGPYVGYIKAFTSNGVFALAVIGPNGTSPIVFAGTDGAGIYRSTNNGRSWTAVNNVLTVHALLAIGQNTSSPIIFAGTE